MNLAARREVRYVWAMTPENAESFMNKLIVDNLAEVRLVLCDGRRVTGVPNESSHGDGGGSFVLLVREQKGASMRLTLSEVASAEIELNGGRVEKFV